MSKCVNITLIETASNVCVYAFLQVVISVGQSLSYILGSITFLINPVVTSVIPFPISGVAGGVAGGGVGLILLLVLVVAIIVVVYRRDSMKKRQQVSALMVQMETLETNMVEECKRGKDTLVHPLPNGV